MKKEKKINIGLDLDKLFREKLSLKNVVWYCEDHEDDIEDLPSWVDWLPELMEEGDYDYHLLFVEPYCKYLSEDLPLPIKCAMWDDNNAEKIIFLFAEYYGEENNYVKYHNCIIPIENNENVLNMKTIENARFCLEKNLLDGGEDE
jgi:hypothetical protein